MKMKVVNSGLKGLQPFKPSRCIKASFYITENRLNFPTTKGFRTKISMKLLYQYMAIFITFPPTSNHLHPLQVENCDSNSRLVVDEDDYGNLRLERVNEFIFKDNLRGKKKRQVDQLIYPFIRAFQSVSYSNAIITVYYLALLINMYIIIIIIAYWLE